eukprot:NODE_5987_length_539_cov_2.346939_g5238_i0.p1 GENE.NODE_5987_length_539_cov_2.346939_g5238_i0~~NODE_5987_length_539_cov_2.346939_g5238_i0.p1  ORF type:complete len:110 (+),score=32.25 NODE_5987_length_539_cov_2.346939_g5238_i0:6-335(+)
MRVHTTQHCNTSKQCAKRMEEDQEQAIDGLHGAVGRLKHTGVEIHSELRLHDDLIGDIDREMGTLEAKLKHATRNVERLLKDSEDKGKLCCIIVLVVVLVVIIVLFFSF